MGYRGTANSADHAPLVGASNRLASDARGSEVNTHNGNNAPVSRDVYDEQWVNEMGGSGSHELFLNSAGAHMRPRLARALEFADLKDGMRVLDIGCGRGEIVFHACHHQQIVGIGLDYATASTDVAKQTLDQLASHTTGETGVVQCDAKTLPFADETFDRIFMLDIIEHLHQWELNRVYREVMRLLRPGGYLIAHTLPNRWTVDWGYRAARFVFRRLPADPPLKRDIFHINEQTVISLYADIREAGLSTRVWLDDVILAHTDYVQDTGVGGNTTTDTVYGVLAKPGMRQLYRCALATPLRLMLSNDLFALAWRPDESPPAALARAPLALTERLLGVFAHN